jgi:hypothetical protein
VIQRIAVDETFDDEFLTEACGVAVTTHVEGHVIIRTFAGGGTGPAELGTVNVSITAVAGDNTFRFRDVGADLLRIEPDGTAIVLVTGQVPFEFAGVLKFDPDTGEVILEPKDRSEKQRERACAALTA